MVLSKSSHRQVTDTVTHTHLDMLTAVVDSSLFGLLIKSRDLVGNLRNPSSQKTHPKGLL